VAIVERGPLKGRDQEWNLSRKEVAELVQQGLFTAREAEECISSEFNPVRAGFYGGVDVWTKDVLNLGIRPDRIIAKVYSPSFSFSVDLSTQYVGQTV
jgi:lycopene cyclase CruP